MSGETEESISGWTVDTLHEHVLRMVAEHDRRYEQRFEAQEHAIKIALDSVNREFHEHLLQVERETQAAFKASEKAIDKAESSVERRLEGMNEFRAALSDSANKNLTRNEHETSTHALQDKIDVLAQSLTDKIDDVKTRVGAVEARTEGKTEGGQNVQSLVFALIGVAGVFAAVVVAATQ